MRFKNIILTVIWLISSINLIGQINRATALIIDSTLTMQVGIYYSRNEFLTNSPGIQSYFKIINDNPDYFFTKKEKNNYFLDFFTDRGTKRTIQLGEVWGFCDGTGVFIENEGKPYQLRYLGAISILRYEKTYHKNQTSQLLTLLATGNTVTEIKEGINVFYVIEDDLLLPYKEEHLKSILSKNPALYQEYMKESKKKRWSRRLFYISEYNRMCPLYIEETGIKIN